MAPATMIQITRIASPMASGPQSGARTHHHDHVMMLQSLRVMKIRDRIPKKGNPAEVVLLMFDMIVFIIMFAEAVRLELTSRLHRLAR